MRSVFFAALAFLALVNYQVLADDKDDAMDVMSPVDIDLFNETDAFDYNETDFYFNETDFNDTDTEDGMEIDCTCTDSGISCSDPSDEEACVCEDGDVICVDMPVDPPTPAEDEPPAPDTTVTIDEDEEDESGAFTASSMITMVVLSAAGIAAIAM